jgi:hypothetical protein
LYLLAMLPERARHSRASSVHLAAAEPATEAP